MKIEISVDLPFNVNIKNYKDIDTYVRKEFGKSLKQLIEQEVDELVKNAAEQTVLRQEIALDIKAIQEHFEKTIKYGEVKIPSSSLVR